MDCPKCGTWNPDDKRVCWRCQSELPKPVEKKRRVPRVILGLPVWAWALLVAMAAIWLIAQCAGPTLFTPR